jgi:hypothetical protein
MQNPIRPVGDGLIGEIIRDIVRALEKDLGMGPAAKLFSLDDLVPTSVPQLRQDAESSRRAAARRPDNSYGQNLGRGLGKPA